MGKKNPEFAESLVDETELELYNQILLRENDELEKLKFKFQRKCFEGVYNKLENVNSSIHRLQEVTGDLIDEIGKLVKHFKGKE